MASKDQKKIVIKGEIVVYAETIATHRPPAKHPARSGLKLLAVVTGARHHGK